MTERKAYGSAWRPNAAGRKLFLSCLSVCSFLLFLLSSSRTRGSRVFSAPPCVRVRLEQNPGSPITNVGDDREESVRVRLEQNPGFPIENVGNDREESVRVRLEQNPGFPINTGSPIRSSITNVEDRRRE